MDFKATLKAQFENQPELFEIEEFEDGTLYIWHKIDKVSTFFKFDEKNNLKDMY